MHSIARITSGCDYWRKQAISLTGGSGKSGFWSNGQSGNYPESEVRFCEVTAASVILVHLGLKSAARKMVASRYKSSVTRQRLEETIAVAFAHTPTDRFRHFSGPIVGIRLGGLFAPAISKHNATRRDRSAKSEPNPVSFTDLLWRRCPTT